MRYLILYHYEDNFEIVDGKKELEGKLYGITEDTIGNGMVSVYNYSELKACRIVLKAKPAWTIE